MENGPFCIKMYKELELALNEKRDNFAYNNHHRYFAIMYGLRNG